MIGAGIDIGTNTFRLLVAECGTGGLQPLVRELETVRLGEGLSRGDLLAGAARSRAMAALSRFREILQSHQPEVLRVCATQALRIAADGAAWIDEVRQRLALEIEVISAREEALLGLTGAVAGLDSLAAPLLLVDVGGGSTEMVRASDLGAPFSPANQVVSMPLGAVGLTERYLSDFSAGANEVAALSRSIEAGLASGFQALAPVPAGEDFRVLAIGGTATALAALDLGLVAYDGQRLHGHCLDVTALERMWERLRRLDAPARNRLPGLAQGRGEIILGGLRIYQLLLASLGASGMQVSDTGLLEGIVLSAVAAAAGGDER